MKAKILLIDDSEAQGRRVQGLLENFGYIVERVVSGVEGLRAARESKPDLVLLDVVMQDIDGFAVCRWLKLQVETRDIPVIMLTVRTGLADRVEGLNIGADDYLPKSFEPEELSARIQVALRVKHQNLQLRERNQELEAMLHNTSALAITDPLTGLFNRRRFADVLKREYAVTRRYKSHLSCILLDLDHFKRINDRHGHDAGDNVLKELAQRIAENLREVDVPARYGGEEFAILLPHTRKEDASIVAERLRRSIERIELTFDGEREKVTISAGVAANTDVSTGDPEELIRAADLALYDAKRSGRNRVVLYDPGVLGRLGSEPPNELPST